VPEIRRTRDYVLDWKSRWQDGRWSASAPHPQNIDWSTRPLLLVGPKDVGVVTKPLKMLSSPLSAPVLAVGLASMKDASENHTSQFSRGPAFARSKWRCLYLDAAARAHQKQRLKR